LIGFVAVLVFSGGPNFSLPLFSRDPLHRRHPSRHASAFWLAASAVLAIGGKLTRRGSQGVDGSSPSGGLPPLTDLLTQIGHSGLRFSARTTWRRRAGRQTMRARPDQYNSRCRGAVSPNGCRPSVRLDGMGPGAPASHR
jgi:hypothetical protein